MRGYRAMAALVLYDKMERYPHCAMVRNQPLDLENGANLSDV